MMTCGQCGQPTSIWQKDVFTGMCPRCLAGVAPVRLGCGTLIIIAIIVAAFSQVDNEDLESEILGIGLIV